MMNYREQVRNGELYLQLNEILRERFPKLKTTLSNALQTFLQKKKFAHPLDFICSLEIHPWGQATQWRIEIDFDHYEWSENMMKPHYLGAMIMLEEVEGKRTLHFSFNIYNSFNPKTKKRHHETIDDQQLFNAKFIKTKIGKAESFLDSLANTLTLEIEKIALNELEILEDDE